MRIDNVESPRLPGGGLVAALFDREVMGLADRGGASNLIGERWANLAADHAASWAGTYRLLHVNDTEPIHIQRVERLDATPRIAAVASKRGLQNPDLVVVGERAGQQVLQAADAKFSVETARAKQVSPDVVSGLLQLRAVLPELLPDVGEHPVIEHGVFLSPDYPLTHMMLRQRQGIVRTTVRPEEVIFVPVDPGRFWKDVPGESSMAPLAAVDDLPVTLSDNLMAGVYYFRLARAATGFWTDAHKPLLLHNDKVDADEAAIRIEAQARAQTASSAIELIRRWDSDVQAIRNQRAAVDQVAALPIPGRELRSVVGKLASSAGAEPPSVNQVRRRLGAWYRGELRARVGPIQPPAPDLQDVLDQVAAAGKEVAPKVERELEGIVMSLIAERQLEEAPRSATQSFCRATDFQP